MVCDWWLVAGRCDHSHTMACSGWRLMGGKVDRSWGVDVELQARLRKYT